MVGTATAFNMRGTLNVKGLNTQKHTDTKNYLTEITQAH